MKTNLDAFLSVTTGDNVSQLYFYGDIVSDWYGAWDEADQYPEKIRSFLSGRTGPLDIYVNSGGGNVFASMAIYNMLKRYKGPKCCYVDGVAASGASVIALAADKVVIPENAYFMIHRAWANACGNVNDMQKIINFLQTVDNGMMSIYKSECGLSDEELTAYLDAETWFTGKDAASVFTKIETAPALEICAKAEMGHFKRAPDSIRKDLETRAAVEKEKIELLKLKGA